MNSKDFYRTMVYEGKCLKYCLCGIAQLNDYKLAYNAYSETRQGGVLDVEQCSGEKVLGILYELSDEALKRLDIREGSKYERIQVEVNFRNTKIQAYTYVIRKKQITKANISYSGLVYHAMLEHGFPREYIDEYVKIVRISVYGSEDNYFVYKANKEKRRKIWIK